MVTQEFVEFFSPGTFCSESTTRQIERRDINAAVEMARSIVERHGARPYGFRFFTRGRQPEDLDSRIIDSTGIYYLGGVIITREEIEARNLPSEEILRFNMRVNNIRAIIENTNSWKFTAPLGPNDTVLEVTL